VDQFTRLVKKTNTLKFEKKLLEKTEIIVFLVLYFLFMQIE